MKKQYFDSIVFSFGIWIPFAFCLLLGGVDFYVSKRLGISSENTMIYLLMSNPFIFVCVLFEAFGKKIKAQDERIRELENKINETS